jgi:deoxyribodipyrimidine photo-lyase
MHNTIKPSIVQVVWFKRDLRIYDAKPIATATTLGPVLAIYVQEPSIWQAPEMSKRHQQFVNESLLDLQFQLRKRANELYVITAEIEAVLEAIYRQYGTFHLLAHEENGGSLTYARDLRVHRWMKARGLCFTEFQHFGVVRRLKNRDDFHEKWQVYMDEDLIPAPNNIPLPLHIPDLLHTDVKQLMRLPVAGEPIVHGQIGGERKAHHVLKLFLHERFPQYLRHISSPEAAALSGSRLSPYLAWGNISHRYVVRSAITRYMDITNTWEKKALSAFVSRLRWHCHFIQRLEDDASLDHRTMNPIFDSIRTEWNEEHFQKWATGHTGIPLIDAGMRALHQCGWVNFRMRAILVSFVCNTLMLDWRRPAHHLAQLFLDFEPGIHYSQMQMQAGVTGFNTIRIYNPIKQAIDHDARGHFVRKYVPELADCPLPELFEPWKSTETFAYPASIVDVEQANRIARDMLWGLKQTQDSKIQAKALLEQHGSRSHAHRKSNKSLQTKSHKKANVSSKPQIDVEQLSIDFD